MIVGMDSTMKQALPEGQSKAPVEFLVPTLKRPDFLRQCLASIHDQTVAPMRVLVGMRRDDAASREVIAEFPHEFVHTVEARGVGVIGSMSLCLKETSERFVALVDDDVELPPHWLETMLGHLDRHPEVQGAAGRDFLQDHPQMRLAEKCVADVGRFHWYGRITGNHHRGGGKPRHVDVLRGSNILFRGDFLREAGFEQELRGQGAQVGWEMALAFQAMARANRFFYDPAVKIVHHVAPRSDADALHRGGWNAGAASDCAFNETLIARKHLRGWRRAVCLAYLGLVGSPLVPGLLHAAKRCWQRDPYLRERITATISGRIAALRHPVCREPEAGQAVPASVSCHD